MKTNTTISNRPDSPSARIDQLAGKPRAEIDRALEMSGALRGVMLGPVITEIEAARERLDKAMEIAVGIGITDVPKLIHGQLVAVDGLLADLRRAPELVEGADRWPLGSRVRTTNHRLGTVVGHDSDSLGNLYLLVQLDGSETVSKYSSVCLTRVRRVVAGRGGESL